MARLATLRLATAQDVPQIAEMARDLIEQGLGWSWTRTRVARNLRHAESSTVVACCGSQVVGFAIMYFGIMIDVGLFGLPGVAAWAIQMIWIPFWAGGVING